MNKTEKIVKEYSSKKLKEILEQQSASYSPDFIDYIKDELIRRGETFQFNEEFQKDVIEMSDDELKNLVEKEWNNFHLEFLEIARKEYLRRNFKMEETDEEQEEHVENKYPALKTIANIYIVFAWILGIAAVLFTLYITSENGKSGLMYTIPFLIFGILIVLGLLAASELIKVFIRIEENTRMTNE